LHELKLYKRLPGYIVGGITYKLAGFLFTPRPRLVCFPVTFRCNSRCQMCNIWQNPRTTGEMDIGKVEEIFSNPLFRKVEEVVLHGGEPTLREDLSEIYRIIQTFCPRLKNVYLSTNGLNPGMIKKRVEEILKAVDLSRLKLTFTVSIDGLKASHEKIRGIPGGFDRALETVRMLKGFQRKYPLEVEIITVIQPQNLEDLDGMEDLAEEYSVSLIYQPLMIDTFYGNSDSDPRLRFSDEALRRYRKFIVERLASDHGPISLYWRNFIAMMDGGRRTVPCAFDRYVLSLYPTGEVLPCSKEDWTVFGNVYDRPVDEIWYSREAKEIRKRMRKEVCPRCMFYCGADFGLRKEFFTYLRHVLVRGIPHVGHRARTG